MSWPPHGGKRRGTSGPVHKGTRMLRQRTLYRGGNPGQPYAEITDPKRIPHREPEDHHCGECFGPRNRYREGQFCAHCEKELFGDSRMGYLHFIRSERQRMRYVRQRWAATGYVPPDHSKEPA